MINWKIDYLNKIGKIITLFMLKRRGGSMLKKTFDQLLIYWKIRVSRNNLQVYTVCFLTRLFKLSSITLCWVITAAMLFLQCEAPAPIVITPGVVLNEEEPDIT